MFPADFDAWRVSDEHFARAYSRTGERDRASIKSCIAALYQARQAGPAMATTVALRYRDGLARTEDTTARPWFVLAVSPEVLSPSMLVAAVLPAVAARIPLVAAVRPGGRGGFAPGLLAAMELCGVEQAFSLPSQNLGRCLNVLGGEHGRGGVAALGPADFVRRVQDQAARSCFFHGLVPPSTGLLAHGVAWNQEVLDFCQAGTVMQLHDTSQSLADAGHEAVFSPAELAPQAAGLVVEPGREFLWDWPDMPGELFFARRLVYS